MFSWNWRFCLPGFCAGIKLQSLAVDVYVERRVKYERRAGSWRRPPPTCTSGRSDIFQLSSPNIVSGGLSIWQLRSEKKASFGAARLGHACNGPAALCEKYEPHCLMRVCFPQQTLFPKPLLPPNAIKHLKCATLVSTTTNIQAVQKEKSFDSGEKSLFEY